MKRIATFAVVVLLLSLQASAADSNIEIMQFRDASAGIASFLVKRSQLDSLPRWNDRQGDPPLSQRRAVDIALAELKRRQLPLESLELHSVSLTLIKEVPVEGLWFYGVTFSPKAGGVSKPYWKSMVLVLMDGSVVNPVVRAQ
jgi:hypothetical protein